MKGKRMILAEILNRTGLTRGAARFGSGSLSVVNYHRVCETEVSTEFDEGVFGPNVDLFGRQMQWLRSNTDVLTEGELIDLAASGSDIKGKLSCVTFDDGYVDNFDLALPVLETLGVPAIFYVPISAIDERKLGWWDVISYLCKKCRSDVVEVAGLKLPTANRLQKKAAIETLLNLMKDRAASETADLLARLGSACGVPLPTREQQDAELMTWGQIAELVERGHAVGSHTISHRVLTTLNAEESRFELTESKTILEERLGSKVRSVSYPVGGPTAYSELIKRQAKEAGYELAFSFNTGTNRGRVEDRFDVRRREPSWHFDSFEASVLMPSLFGGPE